MEVSLKQETCCTEGCGITFWIVEEFRERLVKTKRSFFCPNGHSMHYLGESDADKIARLEKEKRESAVKYLDEIARIKRECKKKYAKNKSKVTQSA